MEGSRILFYVAVVLPAAVLMALEMVSSRLLAPQFGNSVYVWGSIIGIFLAAMSLGYTWGGRLADRTPRLATLGRLVLAAAAAQCLVILFGRQAVVVLGELTRGSPKGTLLATSLLFGPPTLFLATVTPYAVKLAARELNRLGGIAGHLYAVSTAGSLVGTLGATFVLIPSLSLEAILTLLMVLTVVAATAAMLGEWRREKLYLTMAASLLLFAALPRRAVNDGEILVLADRITPYQTLQVTETGGIRFLRSDGEIHAAVEVESREPFLSYPKQAAAALLIHPELRSLLVLGMGGGSVGTFLQRRLPELEVDMVDIDPAISDLAKRFFFFTEHARSRVVIDDARRFVNLPHPGWDYIYTDTYIGRTIPFHLATREFFLAVRARLNEGGVFGVNLATRPETPIARAILHTLKSVFQEVYVFGVPAASNHLFLATDRRAPRAKAELLQVAERLDGQWSFTPTLREMAGRYVELEIELAGAPLLTDQYAPVNHLLEMGRDEALADLPGADEQSGESP